jgi:hypothetical protein
MEVLAGLDHVRKYPDRFLRGVPATGVELAEKLAGDLLLLGGRSTLLLRVSDWYGVASDVRWLGDHASDWRKAFREMRPFPEAGVNSVHSEILIGAFAGDVVVQAPSQPPVLVIGESNPPAHELPEWVVLVVWFRMPSRPL